MGKLELMIQNVYIIIYVSLMSILSLLVNDRFMYLFWLYMDKNTILFIYTPIIFFIYQVYIKFSGKAYVSYLVLMLNMIIMMILSYFIFFIITSILLSYDLIAY
ncbi:hypothetical protein BKG91_10790 [Rodentibacter caecimuris]|uniref:Uncharacterized protein n=1 Tax=Rodentibacter caecimuris TaxID=1796644 RepID=A0AAJ3K5M4_9PAST|nr:hypothetical protein [Rodentibacter pneumotropicus]OOF60721.1 hypothetical protein BH925_04700 [Rodentibacter pneumotropicus]OOF72461.1 hypothetical protein BKG91_10790 [Rodentibacter heylii]OOF73313.1 hypothetical protein BKG90_01555 [Rodentibacter heylii]